MALIFQHWLIPAYTSHNACLSSSCLQSPAHGGCLPEFAHHTHNETVNLLLLHQKLSIGVNIQTNLAKWSLAENRNESNLDILDICMHMFYIIYFCIEYR